MSSIKVPEPVIADGLVEEFEAKILTGPQAERCPLLYQFRLQQFLLHFLSKHASPSAPGLDGQVPSANELVDSPLNRSLWNLQGQRYFRKRVQWFAMGNGTKTSTDNCFFLVQLQGIVPLGSLVLLNGP